MRREITGSYNTGNRLASYGLDTRAQIDAVSRHIANKEGKFFGTMMNAASKRPGEFDRYMAALSDLIAETNDPQELKKYRGLQAEIMRRTYPGVGVVNESHQKAMSRFTSRVSPIKTGRFMSQYDVTDDSVALYRRFHTAQGVAGAKVSDHIDNIISHAIPSYVTKKQVDRFNLHSRRLGKMPVFKFIDDVSKALATSEDEHAALGPQQVEHIYQKTTGLPPARADSQTEIANRLAYRKRIAIKEGPGEPQFRWVALTDEEAAETGSIFTANERRMLVEGDENLTRRTMIKGRQRLRKMSPGLMEGEFAFRDRNNPYVFSTASGHRFDPATEPVLDKMRKLEMLTSKYRAAVLEYDIPTDGRLWDGDYWMAQIENLQRDILSDPRALKNAMVDVSHAKMAGDVGLIPGLLDDSVRIPLTDPKGYAALRRAGMAPRDVESYARLLHEWDDTETVRDFTLNEVVKGNPQEAETAARFYAQIRTAANLPQTVNDPTMRGKLEDAMQRVIRHYADVSGMSREEASRFLDGNAIGSVAEKLNKSSYELTGDIYNRLYGGIRIGKNIDTLVDKALIGQTGFVTGVFGSGKNMSYEVLVQGLRGSAGVGVTVDAEALMMARRAADVLQTSKDLTKIGSAIQAQRAANNFESTLYKMARVYFGESGSGLPGHQLEAIKEVVEMFEGVKVHTTDPTMLAGDMMKYIGDLFASGQDKQATDILSAVSSVTKRYATKQMIAESVANDSIDRIYETAISRATKGSGYDGRVIATHADGDMTNLLNRMRDSRSGTLPRFGTGVDRNIAPGFETFSTDTLKKMQRAVKKVAGTESDEMLSAVMSMLKDTNGNFHEESIRQFTDALQVELRRSDSKRLLSDPQRLFSSAARRSGLTSISEAMFEVVEKPSDIRRRALGIISNFKSGSSDFASVIASGLEDIRSGNTTFDHMLQDLLQVNDEAALADAGRLVGELQARLSGNYLPSDRAGFLSELSDLIDRGEIEGSSAATIYRTDVEQPLSGMPEDYMNIDRALTESGDLVDSSELVDDYTRVKHAGEELADDVNDTFFRVENQDISAARARVLKAFSDKIEGMPAGTARDMLLNTLDVAYTPEELQVMAVRSMNKAQQREFSLGRLARIYEHLTGIKDVRSKEDLSKALQQVIGIEGMDDVQFRNVRMSSNVDDVMHGTNLQDYLIAYGTDQRGRSIARAWQVENGQARTMTAKAAGSLARLEQIGVSNVGRMNNITWDSIEAMNMQMQLNGISEREFAEAAKKLMPDLHADATANEIMRAIAKINRDSTVDKDTWFANHPDLFSAELEGKKLFAANPEKIDPFSATVVAAGRQKSGLGMPDSAEDAFRPAAYEIKSLISGMRTGQVSDEVLSDAAANFKAAINADPLDGLDELMQIGKKAPTLSKVAIGAMAIGGLSAAYRAFTDDPIRTEEFAQYDRPGSKGIARIDMAGTGYQQGSTKQDNRFLPGGARQDTVFKGYDGVVTISDNLETMPSSFVTDLLNRN